MCTCLICGVGGLYTASQAGIQGQREGHIGELATSRGLCRNIGSINQIAVFLVINVYGCGHLMILHNGAMRGAEFAQI